MSSEYVLAEYYSQYLREIRGVSESSVKHYQDALKYISKHLVKAGKIKSSIYEVKDIGELEVIKKFLYNDVEFIEVNTRGHQMYSAGLNNYYKFALGEEFKYVGKEIQLFDIEMPAIKQTCRENQIWSRSTIIKKQVLESASYKCEIDSDHCTFVAKSTGQQYMEGHHLIPMKKQASFNISLDIYANIVCLCPICHRLLHYGVDLNKENILNQIYNTRVDRLANSGIKLSKDEFISLAI